MQSLIVMLAALCTWVPTASSKPDDENVARLRANGIKVKEIRKDGRRAHEVELVRDQLNQENMAVIRSVLSLSTLILVEQNITENEVGFLSDHSNLRSLIFFQCKMNSGPIAKISGVSNLESLSIVSPTVLADDGLKLLTQLPKLTSLTISDASISFKVLEHLLPHNDLRALRLENCRLGKDGLQELKKCQRLQFISIKGTNIGDSISSPLLMLNDLRTVLVDRTEITNEGFRIVAGHPAVRLISVAGTKVTSEVADELRHAKPKLVISGLP